MTLAEKRDRDFLMSHVESMTIPLQFEFKNVRYMMTWAIATVLVTVFIL